MTEANDSENPAPDAVNYDEQLRQGTRDPNFEAGSGDMAETIRLLRNVLGGFESPDASGMSRTLDAASTLNAEFRRVSSSEPPSILPDRFDFLEVAGKGAFGVVWRAFDRELKRTVAIKVPYSDLAASSDLQLRFVRESRAVARLNHPSVVRVLDVGRDGQQTWFVSEFVDGPSLSQYRENHTFSQREAVMIVRDLADAVHHAHSHGVLHRDIKPDNILLEQSDQVDEGPGLPRLTDFGLARIADEDQQLSRTGILIGTPRYMAPEQLIGNTDEHSAATDVYALGVVLYELLAGRGPFDDSQSVTTRVARIGTPIVPLRRIMKHIPRDLSTICQKCLEANATKRYGSAMDLRDDLQRFLDGRPTVARPLPVHEQLLRWTIRNPLLACLLTVIVLASSAISGVTAWNNRIVFQQNLDLERTLGLLEKERDSARESSERAESESQRATDGEKRVRTLAMRSGLQHAFREFDAGEYFRTDRLLSNLRGIVADDGSMPPEVQLLESTLQARFRLLAQLGGSLTEIRKVPGTDLGVVVGTERQCRLVSLTSGQTVREFEAPLHNIHSLAISHDAKLLAVAGSTGLFSRAYVYMISIDSGEVVDDIDGGPTTVESLCFSPDDSCLAWGCRYQHVSWYHIETSEEHTRPSKNRNLAVAFSPDGRRIAMASSPATVQVVRVDTADVLQTINVSDGVVTLDWVPDTNLIAVSGTYGDKVMLFDADDGRLQANLYYTTANDAFRAQCLVANDDGASIAQGGSDGRVTVWHIDSALTSVDRKASSNIGTVLESNAVIDGRVHQSRVLSITWQERDVLSSIGEDGTLSELTVPQSVAIDDRSNGRVYTSATPINDHFLLSCSDGTICTTQPLAQSTPEFRTLESDALVKLTERSPAIELLAVNESESLWAFVDGTGKLTILTPSFDEVAQFTPKAPFSGEAISVAAVRFVPGRDMVVMTGNDHLCRILDFSDGKWDEFKFPLTSRGLTLDTDPLGHLIACGGTFEQIKMVRAADHRLEYSLSSGVNTNRCRFTRDGTQLVSAHDDGSVRVWDVEQRIQSSSMRPHHDAVIDFVLLDSERLLLSVDEAGNVVLSDMTTAEAYGTLYQPAVPTDGTDLLPVLTFNERTSQILAILPTGPDSTRLLSWQLIRPGVSP